MNQWWAQAAGQVQGVWDKRGGLPHYLLPMLIVSTITTFVLLFDRTVRERFLIEARGDVLQRLSTVRARLEGGFNSRLYLADGMISYVVTHPDIVQSEFARFASNLIANKSGIIGIQLARATVISHVFPAREGENMIGVRLLDLPGQNEAVQRALDTRRTVLAGPVKLLQGGSAFISHTPIYVADRGAGRGSIQMNPSVARSGARHLERQYWGVVSLLIDARSILREAGLDAHASEGLRYAVRRTGSPDAQGTVFFGNPQVFHADSVQLRVSLPNERWTLAGIPRAGWTQTPPSVWGWRIGGALLALFGGALGWLWARYPQRLQREVAQATLALRAVQGQLEAKVQERTAELQMTNKALRLSEARLAEAQQISRVGNWVLDVVCSELYWSDEVYRLFGLAPQAGAMTYEGFLARVYPDDRTRVREAAQAALYHDAPYSLDYRVRLPGGGLRMVHEQARIDRDSHGAPVRMAGTVQDITERKQAEQQLQHMAYHDALTGLPNRALLLDRLEHAMAKTRRSAQGMALLFLDLDRFKNVNDSLGHTVGDRLLVQVARRLCRYKREEDTLARLGGDEFTMLLEDVGDMRQIPGVAQKLREALSSPFDIDGREIFISSSIGISLYPGDGDDAETLIKHADTAMYRAKELGRDGYQLFSSDMSVHANNRLALETALRHALERDEFVLYYQPIIELGSGRIAAFEALLRWQHPDRGLILPEDFIPASEDSGLSVAIGSWVLREVCRQAHGWQQAGTCVPRVMINLSARQFSQTGLVGDIARLLDDCGLSPASIGLEITENLLLKDDERVNSTLLRLREMRIPVAIDDFGKGHAAFTYLKRLAVTTLKIDRDFVRELTTDPSDAAIAEAIIAMGHALNLRVVAEGVEHADELALLREYGCDLVQGFYFSAPVPAAAVNGLLTRYGVSENCPQPDAGAP